jgi:V/A-type H+-transporting ATPase subunit D
MELTRLKKKLITARRGHKLLKDKRDELMRQFLSLVRENMDMRKKVEQGIKEANQNFVLARSAMSDEAVRVAFMAPKQEVSLCDCDPQCNECRDSGLYTAHPHF